MKYEKHFFLRTVCNIAIPVTLQSMLQSSFSIIDQIMIGQLGSTNIAAIGLASKFIGIFTVVVSAVATVAGIMIAQYMGKGEREEEDRSLSVNLAAAAVIALFFLLLCLAKPRMIMDCYTQETEICIVAAEYLRILAFTFFPAAGTILLSTMLRCMEKTVLPLLATIIAAVINTVLNYILIFGKLGTPAMGVKGAAIATVISQAANFLFVMLALIAVYRKEKRRFAFSVRLGARGGKQYFAMLIPMLFTEFFWSLGENVYASIYGHIGKDACAAMTLTNPIQGLMIGALSGLAQAAGILIGKSLGKKEYAKAYKNAVKLMVYGLLGAIGLSFLLVLLKGFYVDIYQVEHTVKNTAEQILLMFALISPIKVLNMILGGGIIRSGGKTKIVMWIDMLGTWGLGVPLGLLSAFVWELPIPWVYFILSLEEVVRFVISLIIFQKKIWMQSLETIR